MERRRRHLRELAHAAIKTQVLAQEIGAERLDDLDINPFEEAARAVVAEHKRGRLTDADLVSLGIRESEDGAIWIRVAPSWGRG